MTYGSAVNISGFRVVVAVVACATGIFAALPATAEPVARAEERGDTVEVVHRYVWDEFVRGRKGIHLRTAERDGSDVTAVYDSPRGWTLNLVMDRAGRRVAFSPCCRVELPSMVVVDITTNEVSEPLADHPEIDAVGGIGWSPDGRRIVFEGFSGNYSHRHSRLWTVRPDGTGLRKLLHLFKTSDEGIFFDNKALAWTAEGILYSDIRGLRVARRGESRSLVRRAYDTRISGDGTRIVFTRYERGDSDRAIWIGDSDGTHLQRLFGNEPGHGKVWYDEVTPSYDGQSLSAVRWTSDPVSGFDVYEVVTWDVEEGPGSATVVSVTGDNNLFTWN